MAKQERVQIGRRLREERERLRLTQETFAKGCGVRRLAQYLYELGDRSPTADYLIAAEKAGADLVYILFGYRAALRGAQAQTPEFLQRVYRAVDAMAVDELGRAVPVGERAKMFAELVRVLGNETSAAGSSDLMKRLFPEPAR